MSRSARKPCTWQGCGALTESGESRCSKHRRQVEAERGTANERGYTSAWTRARAAYLSAHPLCVMCLKLGRTVAALVVDHIVPHKGDKVRFWDSDGNWQPLCKPHHDRKTASEDGGFGRRPGGPSKVYSP